MTDAYLDYVARRRRLLAELERKTARLRAGTAGPWNGTPATPAPAKLEARRRRRKAQRQARKRNR